MLAGAAISAQPKLDTGAKKKAAFWGRFLRLLPSTSLQRGTSDTNHHTVR